MMRRLGQLPWQDSVGNWIARMDDDLAYHIQGLVSLSAFIFVLGAIVAAFQVRSLERFILSYKDYCKIWY